MFRLKMPKLLVVAAFAVAALAATPLATATPPGPNVAAYPPGPTVADFPPGPSADSIIAIL
jgi:hypothetical protein